MFRPSRRTQVRPSFIAVAIVFAIYFIFFAFHTDRNVDRRNDKQETQPDSAEVEKVEKADEKIRYDLVVASMKGDDTSWLFEHFPNWNKNIYVVNDETAELTVEKNKGRESMVYLTYGTLSCVGSYGTKIANFVLLLVIGILLIITIICLTICSSYTRSGTNGTTTTPSMTVCPCFATSKYHTSRKKAM